MIYENIYRAGNGGNLPPGWEQNLPRGGGGGPSGSGVAKDQVKEDKAGAEWGGEMWGVAQDPEMGARHEPYGLRGPD